MSIKAYGIIIKGIVQGVGFRPHVYRLAMEFSLNGWVLNSSSGVFIEVEGEEEKLQGFMEKLQKEPPPLAMIRSFEPRPIPSPGFSEFSIRLSESQDEKTVMISPDIAICTDCKREVRDSTDRRFGYPFTNCTNCGPRFTIIKDVPYDRAKTTMAPFPMCPQCQHEYEDPLHRRFHAQPNACPVCGPWVTMTDHQGVQIPDRPVDLLKAGRILAVKGLGGFHLAVDARNREAVALLRQRKRRDVKPFAVMVRDVETADNYCLIGDEDRQVLTSPQAPIVVMTAREDNGLPADIIHPGLDTLGVMLPYTPLHYLLFDQDLPILIMTSANISDEPLIYENQTALEKLGEIADYFMLHNREIYNPCDDSVVITTPLKTVQFMRRARGYVPMGIRLPREGQPVMAVGGEMKNTFCMTRLGDAFLSQHWGDLTHYLNYINFQDGIERFKKMLAIEPQVIAHDLHPNYQSTRWAKEQSGCRTIAVQHHYAHMASVMAENQLDGEVLGMICDGTGWGLDGAVWGCELLRGDYRQFQRLGHLGYLPLPGGDATVKKPYRMAFTYLKQVFGSKAGELAERFLPDLQNQEREILSRRLNQSGSELLTSSCGRLFDAVSAFLGICTVNRYEGQAAPELEAVARIDGQEPYSYRLEKQDGQWIMNLLPAWEEMVEERLHDKSVSLIAGRFHVTMVQVFARALQCARDESGLNRVVLSGGVFHNQLLLVELMRRLESLTFEVYQHRLVPPGDGGIALGQAVVASEVYA
ncbi:MAG TPA: carbamoyltransferase HypF [Syntrophomonadaceae bacterium]|nr:carbamoyltransferase HypF [Syntrophomonadaceae bacterium]